ncbi:MAG: class I SAM-dependent methyltransferase [Betaproteobacteria bacterium]
MQNRLFPDRASALSCATADMVLVQDANGIVVNSAFDPALLRYDAFYDNEVAHSPTFRKHLHDVLGIVRRHLSGRIVEVGCGKGAFLELMLEAGMDALGIDPAYTGNRPEVLRAPFDESMEIVADGIVLRHTLEHVQEPVRFLEGIARANRGGGRIYIEVPCLDWILAHRAWFDIFYEHVNFFRLDDFRRMFGTVHDSGRIFGGQYLYVVADLSTLKPMAQGPAVSFPADFLADMDVAVSGKAAIWGAASKGVIFATALHRRGVRIDVVIDTNKAKQGLFLPVTGYEVRSPGDGLRHLSPGDTIFVMNSNYLDEIRKQGGTGFRYVAVDRAGPPAAR